MATTEPVATTGDNSDLENNPWVQYINVAATLAGLLIALYTLRQIMKGKGV